MRLFACFAVATVVLVIAFPAPGRGQDVPPMQIASVSQGDLKELVQLLEDPVRRDVFVKQLKTLVEIRRYEVEREKERGELPPGKTEVFGVEKLLMRFDAVSAQVVESAAGTASLVAKVPGLLPGAAAFITKPANRNRALAFLATLAGALAAFLVLRLALAPAISRASVCHGALGARLGVGLLHMLLTLAPYGGFLVFFVILSRLFPSFTLAQSVTFLGGIVLLFYRLALDVFRVLLSPADHGSRVLPLSDEDANYAWVWLRRFADYAAFYFLVVETLLLVGMPQSPRHFVRGLLLLVFPLMLSALIMQLSREIRVRHAFVEEVREPAGRLGTFLAHVLRYWPLPALGYSWAVFLFLVLHYDDGFRYLFRATLESAIAVALVVAALKLSEKAFQKLFAVGEKVKENFPGLEHKTTRYTQILHKAFKAAILALGLGATAQVWGVPVAAIVASQAGADILLRALTIVITVGIVVAVVEISRLVSGLLLREKEGEELSKKKKTLIPLLKTIVTVGAIFVGSVVVLGQVGVDTGPILAGAGIVGLAVGFGAQSLVKDLINGLFILFQDVMSVGDWVALGDKGGLVESVGLRTVRLRDLHGDVHVIPNSTIETVTNKTKDFSRYVFDVGVAYRENVDNVMEVLRDLGQEMENDPEFSKDILGPLEIFGLDRFDDSAVVIRARITTKPFRQWVVGREFNRRIKKAFDERGIEIPFPHRTLYLGVPKEGPAPPLQVHTQAREKGGDNSAST